MLVVSFVISVAINLYLTFRLVVMTRKVRTAMTLGRVLALKEFVESVSKILTEKAQGDD